MSLIIAILWVAYGVCTWLGVRSLPPYDMSGNPVPRPGLVACVIAAPFNAFFRVLTVLAILLGRRG
jgi:hypothetical protein